MIPQEQVSLGGETQKEGVGKAASRLSGHHCGPLGSVPWVALWDHGEGASALSERPRGRACPRPGLPRRLPAPPAPRCPCPRSPGRLRGRAVRLRRRPCLGHSDWRGRGSPKPATSVGSAPFASGHQDSPGWECVSRPPPSSLSQGVISAPCLPPGKMVWPRDRPVRAWEPQRGRAEPAVWAGPGTWSSWKHSCLMPTEPSPLPAPETGARSP